MGIFRLCGLLLAGKWIKGTEMMVYFMEKV